MEREYAWLSVCVVVLETPCVRRLCVRVCVVGWLVGKLTVCCKVRWQHECVRACVSVVVDDVEEDAKERA